MQTARTTLWAVAATLVVASGLTAIGRAPGSGAQAAPVPAPARMRIVEVPADPQAVPPTDASLRFEPSTAVLVPGQTVVIENATSAQQEVQAADASFDSGVIEPGGAFVAAVDSAGTIPIATIGTPQARGRLVFGLPALTGAAGTNARSAIPSLSPPETDPADLSPHPSYGYPTSRTQLVLLPSSTATVGEVNAALASVGAVVIGGFDMLDLLTVAVPDTGDLTGVLAARDALEATPAFAFRENADGTVAPGSGSVALVWQGDTERAPAPFDPNPANLGWIFDDNLSALPSRGDYGLVWTRAAMAWDLLDLARTNVAKGQNVDTVVLDGGFFADHLDLDFASVDAADVRTHGTHVAGIVGARFDNEVPFSEYSPRPSRGVAGINPVARLHGVQYSGGPLKPLPNDPYGDTRAHTISDFTGAFNRLLAEKRPGGKYPNLAVVNASFGVAVFKTPAVEAWADAVDGTRCGPLANDDETPSATFPCLPSNQDAFIADFSRIAYVFGQVLDAYKTARVAIAKSAGNDNDSFCVTVDGDIVVCGDSDSDGYLELDAQYSNPFVKARMQRGGGPYPLLVVGAAQYLGAPVQFSQGGPGVDLLAPGNNIRSTTTPQDTYDNPVFGSGTEPYGEESGTSMAAPHVTGALGYLLALAPNLDAQKAVDLVVEAATARSQTVGCFSKPTTPVPCEPLLDVYGAALRAVGIRAAADVNDWTADGNRRVARAADGAVATDVLGSTIDDRDLDLGPQRSEPDGKVDLRDVRAFRDAWLQGCVDGSLIDAGANVAPCPDAASILLDGAPDHPKKDGNGDGCVEATRGACLAGEARYSRFDLNGDGILGLGTPAPVFVDASGAPAASESQLTDWDVLSLALDNRPTFDGWSRGAIIGGSILYTGDVTVDLTQVQPGISDLKVIAKTSERTLEVPVAVGPDGPTSPVVVTAELNTSGSPVELWYTGTRNGQPVVSGTVTTAPLRFGEDTTVALCEAGLRSTGPALLAHNQGGEITVSVSSCTPGALAGSLPGPVSFSITPVDGTPSTSVPVLLEPTAAFDEGGVARTPIAAGTTSGLYKVTATAAVTEGPGGEVVKVERLVRVVPRLEVRYRWESEVTSVDVTTSSDWPDAVPGRPDCREVPSPDGCIVNARTTLTAGAPTPTVTREGTVTLDGNGVTLDETVGGRAGSVSITYAWEDLAASTSAAGTRTFTFGPLPGQSVTDREIPLELALDGDGSILLDGFRFLAEVPYESAVVNGPTTGPDIQPERFGVPGELLPLSVPQPTAVQHSGSPTDVTRLRPSGGGFAPVAWCGTVTTPIERTPGYRLATENDLIQGAVVLANDPVYGAGKIPMPAGSGSFQRRIRVAFTAAQNGAAADPVLPGCTGTSSPTAAFDVAPQPDGVLQEGDAIRFLDRSTDPDGDLATWSWSFARSDRNPVLVPGLEDGANEVSLRVADTGGRFNRVFQTLDVANVLPTVTPVTPLVTVQEGDRATIEVRLDDPGPVDRTRLNVRVAEGGTELLRGAPYPAGTARLALPVLAPGAHRVSVFVYDGNRQFVEVRADVTVAVVRQEVTAPADELSPVVRRGTCSVPVALAADEAALLQRWNAARERAGLAPLALSPELSRAAAVLAGQSIGGLGLAAGADVGKAADDAGYAGQAVRALPFSRDVDPMDVLEGLRASEPGTVFTSTGRMVGVAKVAQGSNVKWVVVVGEVVDCDVTPVAAGTAPQLAVTPPPAPLVEGAAVQLGVTATDPDGDLAEVRVDWGDGTVAGTSHRYRDDGTYVVRVRAVDEQGNVTAAAPLRLTVTGAPPEFDVAAGELVAGTAGSVELAAADPAEGDRPLQLTVTSVPAGVASYTGTIDGGRTLRVTPPVGSTQLDLTVRVTDNDGLSTLKTVSLPVVASPGPAPTPPANVVAPAESACAAGTAGVALRAQASDFLVRANAFRQTMGAPTLVVSKELQQAAELQLADLLARRYFGHLDSTGRTPLDRARLYGYAGGVGENIARRFVSGSEVLLGWRSSPVHLENLIDPVWTATGVAVGNGPDGVVWVQVFGTVPTCPTADRSPVPAPALLANPPLDAAAPVAGWSSLAPVAVTEAAPRAASLPVPAAAPVLAQQTPAPSASVAAFTVSDVTPAPGQNVTVTNRSRDAGTNVSGSLTFGSVSNRLLAPGESFQRAVFSTQDIALAAAGATATTSVTGTGSYVPQLTLLGPAAGSSFDQGAAIPVQVLVTDGAATPTPLAGVRVRSRANPPGSDYVIGATGPDGKATLTVRPSVAGPVVLEVQAETVGADTWVATTTRSVTITANTAPVFPVIDPLTVELQQPLRLWVPEAVDADVPVAYSWDLDGNGAFGDLGITTRDAQVSWAQVSAVICGGVCTADQAETLTIRATDSKGAATDAPVIVTPVRDFQVALNPQRLSLPPGGSTTVAVTIVTTSGFARPVTLSASGLPAGINASFLPETINPGEVGNLTLSVDSTYSSTASVPLVVTGTATDPVRGTIVRTTTPTVSVIIGLDRICTVSWSGVVRNAETRAALAGATVRVDGVGTVVTGPDGRWTIPVVPVAGNNGPASYYLTAIRTGYHERAYQPNGYATAVCDANRSDLDIELYEKKFVPMNVQVNDAAAPTVVPAATRVDIQTFVSVANGPVDVNGRFTALLPLQGPDNRAADFFVSASAPGYHQRSTTRAITKDALPGGITVPLQLTRICTARFVGGVVVDADGRIVPGARVAYGQLSVESDANGRFTIDRDVALGPPDNTPVDVVVNASPPNDRPDLVAGFGVRQVDQCGSPFEMTVVLGLNRNGPARFATLQGRFLSPAGQPITDGRIVVNGLTFYGNRDGTYSSQLFIGRQDAVTGAEPSPAFFRVFGSTNGTDATGFPYWWPTSFDVTLAANEVRTADIVLQPVTYGTITGVLVDAGTGAPLANQVIDVATPVNSFGVVTSGPDGRFAAGNMRQAPSGTTNGSASSRETSTYWPGRASGRFAGDPATVDLVVPAIRKCAPATVNGIVVENAPPNAPLAGVTVQLDTGERATTGTDGTFALNAGPYFENAPREVTITASKEGFVNASRRVFIFCGAALVVDFAPQSETTGTITGIVTTADGTTPVPGVFVGTEYGGGTTTGDDGRYTLTGVPLSPDGSGRTWKVSAVPTAASGLVGASVSVPVTADVPATADFRLQARDSVPVNRPPVAVITPNGATVPEGTRVDLSAATSSDPDDDKLTYAWDVGADGSVDGISSTFALQLLTPGPRTVKLTVSDGRGLSATTQVTVTYTNVPPTVVAGADETVGPDGVFTRSARFDDPSTGDEYQTSVDWGDGSGFVPLPRFARTLDLAHTYAALGSYNVTVRVCDAYGACAEGSFTVTVSATPPNRPPVARLTGPTDVVEGNVVAFDASTSTDPEGQVLAYAWDLDADGDFDDAAGPTASMTASTAGERTIVVLVTDPAGGRSIASLVLTVRGAAPSIDAIGDQSVGAGQPLAVIAVVRDTVVAPGGYRATIDWGDGAGRLDVDVVAAGAAPGASGMRIVRAAGLAAVGTVPLSRTFAAPGRYTAVLTVCDTACTELRFQVAVTPSVVRLPSTGAAPLPVLWLGLGTLGAGAALVAVSRRRRLAR